MSLKKRFAGLKVWQKLAVIAVALGGPAVGLGVFYIGSISSDGEFVKAELDGLDVIEPIDEVVALLPAHRGLTAAADKEFAAPRVAEVRAKIDDAVKKVDAATAKVGAKFGTVDAWKAAKEEWVALRDATDLPAAESAERHDKLLAAVLAVQLAVSEKSNLVLDPVLTTYYLQDNLTLRVPPLADGFAEVRAGAAANPTTPEQRLTLAAALGKLSAARAGFDGNVTALKDRAPAEYERLAPKHAAAVSAADEFAALVQKQLLAADGKAGPPPAEVWDRGSAALAAYSAVGAETGPALRGLLDQRYQAANARVLAAAALIVVVLVFASALVYGIARGINTQTRAIARVLGQVAVGNVRARAAVTSRDELGELAGGLNAMLDTTVSLRQSQDERDQIQASIMRLLDEVSGVAQGDLTTQAEVTADVTGAIADSFNYMIDQLRQIIGDVQKATVQVTGSAGRIFASTQHLAGGADQQAARILQTSRAVEDMTASIRQVSDGAARSAAVAKDALANARRGNESVKTTIAGMDRIRDQVQETAKRIKRLGESSQEIGQIVQLIDDIADRTSILALNASIQAAMAGEAGRGFAVVAEEVERLADRSTDATKKIAALVKAIQSETTEATAAMEKGIQEVVAGSKLAAEAGSALDEIEGVSRKLADLIGGISDASRQQAQASDGVTAAMTDISAITRQTATGTKQAADAAQALSRLADGLRASVSAFKLPAGAGEASGQHAMPSELAGFPAEFADHAAEPAGRF